MFERFTERARQVVVPAPEETRTLKHNSIGADQILLKRLRPEARATIRRAEALAREFGHLVGPSHVLVALAESRGTVRRVLSDWEVTAEDLRGTIDDLFAAGNERHAGSVPLSQELRKVLSDLPEQAETLGRKGRFGTEELMLALLAQKDGMWLRALEASGYVRLPALRDDLVDAARVRSSRYRASQGGSRRFGRRLSVALATGAIAVFGVVPIEIGPIDFGRASITIATQDSSSPPAPATGEQER
jgi:hypothetical protein